MLLDVFDIVSCKRDSKYNKRRKSKITTLDYRALCVLQAGRW